MIEIKLTLSSSQLIHLRRFKGTLHSFYTKGNNSYTTLSGYKLDMRESMNLLDSLLMGDTYKSHDKEQLNEIRSMYIQLHNDPVSVIHYNL